MKSVAKHKALSELMGMLMPGMISKGDSPKKKVPVKGKPKVRKMIDDDPEPFEEDDEKPIMSISLTELSSIGQSKPMARGKKKKVRRKIGK